MLLQYKKKFNIVHLYMHAFGYTSTTVSSLAGRSYKNFVGKHGLSVGAMNIRNVYTSLVDSFHVFRWTRILKGSVGLNLPLRPLCVSKICVSSFQNRGKKDETNVSSLFVPVPVKPNPDDINIGAELTGSVNKADLLKILNKFYQKKELKLLALENGLDNYLLHQAFVSFRRFCLEAEALPADLHVVVSDILQGAGHVDDIFPYFLRHARQIFPHLECMDDLKKISDLRTPANWYPSARAITRKIVFHAGPTNSGKTYHALERFMSAESGVYCGPLKLLAVEVFNKCNERGTPCDLVTGEERRYANENNEPSNHVSCTVEMTNLNNPCDVAVIDEIQMLRDPQRGWAWTRALLGVIANEIHLCGEEGAIPLVEALMLTTGEDVQVCRYKRLTELEVEKKALGSLDQVRPGDCIVCFSKADVYSVSRRIESLGREVAVIYGGLPPGTKLAQARKFNDPEDPCKILVATDAIGMGLNFQQALDIFTTLCTMDDSLYFMCNTDDFKFLAEMIQHVPLPLRARYVFCCAPINKRMPFVCSMFLKFARQYSRNDALTFDWLCRHIGWPFSPPRTIIDLVHLEAVFDVLDLYLWFSYRFVDLFPDIQLVRDMQKELDKIIQEGVLQLTRLLRNSENGVASIAPVTGGSKDGGLRGPEPGSEEDDFLMQQQRQVYFRKVKDSGDMDKRGSAKLGKGRLTERLLAQGLLTPNMLQELQREWTEKTEDDPDSNQGRKNSKRKRKPK
ncbi:hypothetical protein J437_LFUL010883 [Ladona fulva]|uniref:ATP-dependent RNA helicase SUV3 homolog, mitochondrial n=1 Tax=Ladona fulva TaxID=123851 RepID=A0A8K0KFD4_LADFU|nr:hypothetical protein J437_LFUL010883 [Ladona fulva]